MPVEYTYQLTGPYVFVTRAVWGQCYYTSVCPRAPIVFELYILNLPGILKSRRWQWTRYLSRGQ